MARIERVRGRRVWDSRGRPGIEAEITLERGIVARAIAPSPNRWHEAAAKPLYDCGAAFAGLDVSDAVAAINEDIGSLLDGLDARDQSAIDRRLIAHAAQCGCNAVLAVSIAVAKAGAQSCQLALWRHMGGDTQACLPRPAVELLSGAQTGLAHEGSELSSLTLLALGAGDFATALDWACEVTRAASVLLGDRTASGSTGTTGGLTGNFDSADDAIELAVRAIERAGFHPGEDIALALDIAANRFGRGGRYLIGREGSVITTSGMIERSLRRLSRYPIASLTDPLAEDDLAGIAHLTSAAGSQVIVAGGEVLISSPARIEACAKLGAFNAVELRLSDHATLTEMREAVRAAQSAGFKIIVRGEDGEDNGDLLVHLAVAFGAEHLSAGGLGRGERSAIWNGALRLSEALALRLAVSH